MQNRVLVVCDKCKKSFYRKPWHHKQWLAKGGKQTFCSKECHQATRQKDAEYLYFVHQAKRCRKGRVTNLDLAYIKQVYLSQRGICKLSGIRMTLPLSPRHRRNSPTDASLDRIDSSRGYVRGNVQFVCQFINLGKREFSDLTIKRFLKLIRSSYGSRRSISKSGGRQKKSKRTH